MSITVDCNSPQGGVVGTPYTHQFLSDNMGALFYIFFGLLPSGLTMDDAGLITGTPDTISWTPAQLSKGSQSLPITLNALNTGSLERASIVCGISTYLNCLPLTPSCGAPPGGSIALPYSHSLLVDAGGVAPFTFVQTGGTLPPGLMLAGDGTISGVPTTNGLYSFVVEVSGAGSPVNNVASMTCSISIGGAAAGDSTQLYFYAFGFLAPLAIGCGDPPTGSIGNAYFHLVPILGGTAPYTFSISGGALPTGLSIDPATGIISGTPSADGTFNFDVDVVDADLTTETASCTIVITAEALALSGTPPVGDVGTPYSFTFTASGGTPPYTFEITTALDGVTLCPGFGLVLDPLTGEISGVPLLAGTCCFTIEVTDDLGDTASLDVCVTIRGCVLSFGGF